MLQTYFSFFIDGQLPKSEILQIKNSPTKSWPRFFEIHLEKKVLLHQDVAITRIDSLSTIFIDLGPCHYYLFFKLKLTCGW